MKSTTDSTHYDKVGCCIAFAESQVPDRFVLRFVGRACCRFLLVLTNHHHKACYSWIPQSKNSSYRQLQGKEQESAWSCQKYIAYQIKIWLENNKV